jgi:hypothetical protein
MSVRGPVNRKPPVHGSSGNRWFICRTGSRFEGSEVVAKRTIKNKRRYVFKVLTLGHVGDM